MQMDTCYIMQIFELDSDKIEFTEIPSPYICSPLSTEEEDRERERIKKSLLLEGKPLVNICLFACRTFETARDIMLDGQFIQADWVSCYEESDLEGRLIGIYISTDREFLCKIFRTDIY